MSTIQKISPHLWFDDQAEEAANFYVSVFSAGPGGRSSNVGRIARYGKEGFEFHQRPEGSVLTVEFTIHDQVFIALNGGPVFSFTEAISFIVQCDSQEEIDYYWEKLSEGGDKKSQQCGWLKDKFGVSWQIVPSTMRDMVVDADHTKTERLMHVMFKMKKLDKATLETAFKGKTLETDKELV